MSFRKWDRTEKRCTWRYQLRLLTTVQARVDKDLNQDNYLVQVMRVRMSWLITCGWWGRGDRGLLSDLCLVNWVYWVIPLATSDSLDFVGEEIWDADAELGVNKYRWKLKAEDWRDLTWRKYSKKGGLKVKSRGSRWGDWNEKESFESGDSLAEWIIKSDRCNTVL